MKITLFTIPFAGGNEHSYDQLANFTEKHIELVPLSLPGRSTRFSEPLKDNIYELANDLVSQIKCYKLTSYAIYGHSMGAILAYLVTKNIMSERLPAPRHLFVSGYKAPSLTVHKRTEYRKLPKLELKTFLQMLGGSNPEILAHNELFGIYEKIIRNDFHAIENYKYIADGHLLPVPITIMSGIKDKIKKEELEAWKIETNQPCTIHKIKGGHFFIYEQASLVANIINATLTSPSVALKSVVA